VAVSPLRALLEARAITTWNRLRRESGEAGQVAGAVVALLMAAALFAPTAFSARAGFTLGEACRTSGGGLRETAAFHAVCVLAAGLLGGLFAHETSFASDTFRAFPLPPRQLLLAELAASSVGLASLLALCSLSAFALGYAVADPLAAPFVLLLAAHGVLWMLVLQHAVGELRRRVLRRGRLGFVPFLLAIGLVVAAVVSVQRLPREERGRRAGEALLYWPAAPAYKALAGLRTGGAGRAMMVQALPLAVSVALVLAAARMNPRRGGAPVRRAGRDAARLWTFDSPSEGVARVFVTHVMATMPGRMVIVIPAITTAMVALTVPLYRQMIKDGVSPVPGLSPATVAAAPWLAILPPTVVLMSTDFFFNQFGWLARGMRTLIGLPLSTADLLRGVTRGLFFISGLQIVIAVAPLFAIYRPDVPSALFGLLAAATAVLLTAAVGHVVSAALPRAVSGDRSGGAAPIAVLVKLVVSAAVGALLVLAWKGGLALGPWAPPLVMALVSFLVALGYRAALPFLAHRVSALRETLTESLG